MQSPTNSFSWIDQIEKKLNKPDNKNTESNIRRSLLISTNKKQREESDET